MALLDLLADTNSFDVWAATVPDRSQRTGRRSYLARQVGQVLTVMEIGRLKRQVRHHVALI